MNTCLVLGPQYESVPTASGLILQTMNADSFGPEAPASGTATSAAPSDSIGKGQAQTALLPAPGGIPREDALSAGITATQNQTTSDAQAEQNATSGAAQTEANEAALNTLDSAEQAALKQAETTSLDTSQAGQAVSKQASSGIANA